MGFLLFMGFLIYEWYGWITYAFTTDVVGFSTEEQEKVPLSSWAVWSRAWDDDDSKKYAFGHTDPSWGCSNVESIETGT